jgi:hypothetical protein
LDKDFVPDKNEAKFKSSPTSVKLYHDPRLNAEGLTQIRAIALCIDQEAMKI